MTVGLSYRPRRRGFGWTAADIPDLTGTTALVTGANSGIGLETAAALAAAGARVMLACRNQTKSVAATEVIRERYGAAQLDLIHIDTSDIDTVRAAAVEVLDRTDRLDLLVNNAGVAWPPYALSPQGVEMQLATNFLGHFALTGLLLDRMQAAPAARGNVNLNWPQWDGQIWPGGRSRWLAPEDAGGVFVDFGEQVGDAGRGVEQVVAVESLVAVTPVEGPGFGGGGVAQSGDREADPVRAEVFTPGRAMLGDGQMPGRYLAFEAYFVACFVGNSCRAPALHACDVKFGQCHSDYQRGWPAAVVRWS